MPEAPRATIDDQPGVPEPTFVATVVTLMAYASFAAFLVNSYAIEQFLAEVARLLDKFL